MNTGLFSKPLLDLHNLGFVDSQNNYIDIIPNDEAMNIIHDLEDEGGRCILRDPVWISLIDIEVYADQSSRGKMLSSGSYVYGEWVILNRCLIQIMYFSIRLKIIENYYVQSKLYMTQEIVNLLSP